VSRHPLGCYLRAVLVVDRCSFFLGDQFSWYVFKSAVLSIFSLFCTSEVYALEYAAGIVKSVYTAYTIVFLTSFKPGSKTA